MYNLNGITVYILCKNFSAHTGFWNYRWNRNTIFLREKKMIFLSNSQRLRIVKKVFIVIFVFCHECSGHLHSHQNSSVTIIGHKMWSSGLNGAVMNALLGRMPSFYLINLWRNSELKHWLIGMAAMTLSTLIHNNSERMDGWSPLRSSSH